MNEIVKNRYEFYGDPVKRMTAVARIVEILDDLWEESSRESIPAGAIWPLNMIADKLTRVAVSPWHKDSWDDIIGYAEIGLMAINEEAKENENGRQEESPSSSRPQG